MLTNVFLPYLLVNLKQTSFVVEIFSLLASKRLLFWKLHLLNILTIPKFALKCSQNPEKHLQGSLCFANLEAYQ